MMNSIITPDRGPTRGLYYIYISLTLKPHSRRYIKGLISKSIKYTNLLDYVQIVSLK